MTYNLRNDLTPTLKRALVVILEDGKLTRRQAYWASDKGRKVFINTLLALYDRYLVKIIAESRHRKKLIAKLTDVGQYAALELQRQYYESQGAIMPKPANRISETAARFIVEVTSP